MLLKCDLVVLNRLTPGMENRKTHSTIVLAKEKKKDKSEIFFTVYTVKSKAGSKYKVRFFYTLVFFWIFIFSLCIFNSFFASNNNKIYNVNKNWLYLSSSTHPTDFFAISFHFKANTEKFQAIKIRAKKIKTIKIYLKSE